MINITSCNKIDPLSLRGKRKLRYQFYLTSIQIDKVEDISNQLGISKSDVISKLIDLELNIILQKDEEKI
ncbi:MAG TPA: hypothetical protein VJH20_04620 [Candidatus Nanoarchaeia archaeon]|nr:hypothetical protein [Candidatus Nanoarchaeia archaeon]